MKIEFLNAEFFYLLGLLLFLLMGKRSLVGTNYKTHFSKEMFDKIFINNVEKQYSYLFLLLSFVTLLVALARPVWYDSVELEKKEKSFLVGLDLSKSMNARDIYPSRLEFGKSKLLSLLKQLDEQRVGILGFSSESFLIAPLTADYNALSFSINNLALDTINTKGSEIFSLLEYVNIFLSHKEQKVLLLFTDGTETQDFEKSIIYANEHNIKIFVYAIATSKGSAIEEDGKLLKDKNGNIVVTSINEKIKTLCEKTGGKYFEYSTRHDDIYKIKDAIHTIMEQQKTQKENSDKQKELFYIPLVLSLLFFLLSVGGFEKLRDFIKRISS
jgi:Ca-activated chloride channel family protein